MVHSERHLERLIENISDTSAYLTLVNIVPPTKLLINSWFLTSSETQGRLAGARGNKSGKEMKRRRFTSKAERLLPDHFQTALPMLPPDWAEKSFVLFCPIGEQQLLRYCGVFLHDDFRIAILALFVYQCSACEGNFHFNFL